MQPIDQLIYASIYAEFPETILHLELARACARADKRSINAAMRHCARTRMSTVRNKHLKATLQSMSSNPLPEVNMAYLKNCLAKMRSALQKELKMDNIDLQDAVIQMEMETARQ